MLFFYISLGSVIDATSSFTEEVRKYKHTFVKFYSPGCPACVRINQTFADFESNALVQKHGIQLMEVNCVDGYTICQEQGIKGYPNIRYYHQGKFVDKFRNVNIPDAWEDWLDEQIQKSGL